MRERSGVDVGQARTRQARFQGIEAVGRHIKGVQTPGVAHLRPNRQGFAARASTKIDHHFATLGIEQQGQQLRAFVLHLDAALHKGLQLGQRRFVLHAQAPGGVRRGFGGNPGSGQLFDHGLALGIQGIDAQIQRCRGQQAGGQSIKLFPQLGLQRLGQPLGQVVAVLGQQLCLWHGITLFQPGFFCGVECRFQQIARAGKAQNGQSALARSAARAGQGLKAQLVAQHGVGGFGQRGAFARAQAAVLPKKARDHAVGRVLKQQHLLH